MLCMEAFSRAFATLGFEPSVLLAIALGNVAVTTLFRFLLSRPLLRKVGCRSHGTFTFYHARPWLWLEGERGATLLGALRFSVRQKSQDRWFLFPRNSWYASGLTCELEGGKGYITLPQPPT